MSGHGQSQKSPCACHPHMHMVAARLALKGPWLVLGGPPPTMTASTGLESTTLTLWSKSRHCLLRLEVDMSSVLELELGQKWCIKGMTVYAKSGLK